MGLRGLALMVVVLGLMMLSVRRWYLALCGLVFLTTLNQHPSMPTSIGGIAGLNPWNALWLVIIICWANDRRQHPHPVPVPRWVVGLIGAYVVMVVVTGLMAVMDSSMLARTTMAGRGTSGIIIDGIINPLKYLVVGILFFDGARDLQRVRQAMISAVASGMCYSFLLFKSMNTRVFTIDYEDARRMTDKLVGLFANDLGQLFAVIVWAAVCMVPIFQRRWVKAAWLFSTAVMLPPFIALKSRAGFVAFSMIALVLGLLRYRSVLIAYPIMVAVTIAIVPSVRDRVMQGVRDEAVPDAGLDWNEVSAGRVTGVWPPIIEQIPKSPIWGHGRYGIARTPAYEKIQATERIVPGHPHNAYLEILLDAGAIGLIICMTGMVGIIWASMSLMRVRQHRTISALGTVGLAAAVGLMTAGIAGASFFPTQSTMIYLVIWGTVLRVYFERKAALQNAAVAAMPLPPPRRRVVTPVSGR